MQQLFFQGDFARERSSSNLGIRPSMLNTQNLLQTGLITNGSRKISDQFENNSQPDEEIDFNLSDTRPKKPKKK